MSDNLDGLDVFFGDPTAEEDEQPPKAQPVSNDQTETQQPSQERDDFPDAVFKKWYRTKQKSGFLSLDTWLEAGKVSVDIGEVAGGETSNTKVWCNAVELATYLRAIANDTAEKLYPKRGGLNSPESFINYGGGKVGGRDVSRILKVTYWGSEERGYDASAFNFKAGHFVARVNEQGAYIPDMDQLLSMNMIKMSRAEVAQMSFRLDIAIHRFANIFSGDAFRALNGNMDR